MTLEQDSLSAAFTPNTAPKRFGPPQVALVLGGLALIAAAGAFIYEQQQTAALKDHLAAQLAVQTQRANEAQAAFTASQTRLRTMEQELALLTAHDQQAQGQQATLNNLYDSLTRTETQRALADIEQTLTAASQQLQLAGGVDAALVALNSADQKLLELNKPELITVRQVLSKDIEKLKTLPALDIVGMTAQLDSVMETLDRLPLAIDTHPVVPLGNQPASRGAVTDFGSEVWNELKQLIVIRRMDKPDAVLLSPDQAFFLRENIKLRLLDARSALLRHDQKSYSADLAAAQKYLQQYFDNSAANTQEVQARIKQLAQASLTLTLPTLDTSLAAVRNARAVAERAKP
ncbi:uroporphyrinogen-III C-methyltransferase [Amantichitinum ursilacus]|uniref:Putative uroporphyrinogen-III C-methyltransferase n=1 Tax=Amantichitinum ursilacus TaxID=857265 RepID=A0A0N0XHS4_9NEIS|nr:uroporphyrinogen-III C-methyltransferase [Amantichitinum ursilacus]KPC52033.1 putative uroporphyrinogen-III C-methyltransferase [Amantichitinum ursilacus]